MYLDYLQMYEDASWVHVIARGEAIGARWVRSGLDTMTEKSTRTIRASVCPSPTDRYAAKERGEGTAMERDQ